MAFLNDPAERTLVNVALFDSTELLTDPYDPARLIGDLFEETPGLSLATAIHQLPSGERLILSLVHFEELSVGEIAEVLNIPEREVEQLHASAVAQLRLTCC